MIQASTAGRLNVRHPQPPLADGYGSQADRPGPGFAPAKVNLFLHVGPLEPDGYHPLASWMAFADVGDRIEMAAPDAGSPTGALSPPGLEVQGLFAADLAGEDPAANLVWRAAQALLAQASRSDTSLHLRLDKALPVAAGLGGGSSDAGAALKLIRDQLALAIDDDGLAAIAATLGADGPACLYARPVLALGRGDQLSPAPVTPQLPAVLVNPRVACPTGRVYRTFDTLASTDAGADTPELPERFESVPAVIAALAGCRNDLEPAAIAVTPEISAVLALLRAQSQTRLARLSGSGATAFALCDTEADTELLAAGIARQQPHWWVRVCRIGDPWTGSPAITNP